MAEVFTDINSMDISLSKLQKIVKDREAWHAAVLGVTKNLTWLSNWTTITLIEKIFKIFIPWYPNNTPRPFFFFFFFLPFFKNYLPVVCISKKMALGS